VKRETIVLLIALAVLIVVYLVVRTGPTGPGSEGGPLLPDLDPSAIDTVSVLSPTGRVDLARTDGGWVVASDPVEPPPADPVLVERAVAALVSLDRDETASVVAEKHSLFGVSHREATVVRAGRSASGVALGDRSPDGRSVYVRRLDEEEVYLAPGSVADAFPAEAVAWRDRTPARFAPARVTELILSDDVEGTIVLRRSETGWFLAAPLDAPVEGWTMSVVLKAIETARAEVFLDDGALDPRRAAFELTLLTESGREIVLRVFDAGERHAVAVPGRGVFGVEKERFDLIENTIVSMVRDAESAGRSEDSAGP